MLYREQQQQLEARIVHLERELSEGKDQLHALDDARQRLRETERVCQELAEQNRRLWAEVPVWQERLAASEESQRQVSILWQRIQELQTEDARLIKGTHRAQEEFAADSEPVALARLITDFNGLKVIQTTADTSAELSSDQGGLSAAKMPSEIATSATKSLNSGSRETHGDELYLRSGDSAAKIHLEKEDEANWVPWTSVKRQWRLGAVAASVVVIAGAVATGVLGTKFSGSKEVAVAPETKFQEYTVEAVSKPQKKPARRLRGIFQTVRPTQVYSGPSENSAFIADIGAGMKFDVVDSTYGWLEIRSRHGRPPGFVRQEATVTIALN
jgi:hypothetical protein